MNGARAGEDTVRCTVAQALITFLSVQHTERDGHQHRLIEGCLGIFGHGNLAGIGEALAAAGDAMPYRPGHNEQAMVHAAAGFARTRRRLSTLACTTSVGPGATNTVTGAAGATINHLPVLLLLGDTFATRRADPVLQQLEHLGGPDLTVNDCLRPVSRFFDRITRPEQLLASLPQAMAVLADPARTGTVTLALPEDVQTEAFDVPASFLAPRLWHVARQPAEASQVELAASWIRAAQRPLIVAGGGVLYSDASDALGELAIHTGIPVAETQAGKGAVGDHPLVVGGIGATGTPAANALARDADLVIGIGTRWTDFTTASRTAFADPGVRFVNLNVVAFDAHKHRGLALVADARAGIGQLADALDGWEVTEEHRGVVAGHLAVWNAERSDIVDHAAQSAAPKGEHRSGRLAQRHVIGALQDELGPNDILVAAAGSAPGDLHKLWRARSPGQYHMEYGYSCMGYEIAGAFGAKLAAPHREVYAIVGDGSFLMMSQDIATSVQEGAKIVVVLLQSHGYASIGSLSESVGSHRFGTEHRLRSQPDTDLPVDLAANAASLGAQVVSVCNLGDLPGALAAARQAASTTVVHIEIDPSDRTPSYGWWDVPVAEVSSNPDVRDARRRYEDAARAQRRDL